MKLRNLLIASGIALALPISVVTFSHVFEKETVRVNASNTIPAADSIQVEGTSLVDKKYYVNGGGDGDSSNYNYFYDSDTGILTLKDFVSSKRIYCTSENAEDALRIELIGTNAITFTNFNSTSHLIECGCQLIVAGDGTLNLTATNEDTIDKEVWGIYGGYESTVTIQGNAKVNIDVNESKCKNYGIRSKKGFSLLDGASLNIEMNSYEGNNGYAIYNYGEEIVFNSTGHTSIAVGATQRNSNCDYAIYNDGLTGSGSITFIGSGLVELINSGNGFAEAISARGVNANSEIVFDGCEVKIRKFDKAVYNRGKARYPEDYDIKIQNHADVFIDSGSLPDTVGLESARNGILVDNSDLYFEGKGAPFSLKTSGGFTNNSLGFDVNGSSHIDFDIGTEDHSILSQSNLTHNFNLTGDGYFDYRTWKGTFPNTSVDSFYVKLEGNTRLVNAAYMNASEPNADGGIHYTSSYYAVRYKIEAYTPPSLAASVSVNGHTLTEEKPYYHNGEEDASATKEGYNAYYEFNTGILHLYEYNGGAISLSDSTAGALFRIDIEGDSTITVEGSQVSTVYGLNVGGDTNLEIYTHGENPHSLVINVSNDKGDVTGLGTAKGSLRVTGHTELFITAECKDNTARSVKGINTDYQGGGNGNITFEGHAYIYSKILGVQAASLSASLCANSGSITFDTIRGGEIQLFADEFQSGPTYTLWASSKIIFNNFTKILLMWHEDGALGGPTYPTNTLTSLIYDTVNISETLHAATVWKGAKGGHIDLINGSCNAYQGNYRFLETAYLYADTIGGLTFKRWEKLSGGGHFTSDSQGKANAYFSVSGNAVIEATYNIVSKGPFFDVRDQSTPAGYLCYEMIGTPTGNVSLVDANNRETVVLDNAKKDIAYTSGDLPAGDYKLRATYSGHTLYSDTFTVNYSAAPHDYSLTFNAGAGSGSDYVINAHGSITLPEFNDTGLVAPEGYRFTKWYCDGEYAPGAPWSISDDYVFTALYEEIPSYTLTFAHDAHSTGSMESVVRQEGTVIALPEPGFTPNDNYRFKAWDVSGTERAVGYEITLTSDIEVTAIYEEIPMYTLSFDKGDGSGSMDAIHAREGETINLPSESTFVAPEHKKLTGWSIGGVDYALGASYKVTSDVTITAIYGYINRTITFNGGGATGSMAPVGINDGFTYTLPGCHFNVPEGKEFDGWMIGDVKYQPGDTITVTSNLTITATWKDIPVDPDTPVDPVDPDTPENKGLSTGAIIAIVVPSAIVASVGIFALVWFVFMKKTWADFAKIFKKK